MLQSEWKSCQLCGWWYSSKLIPVVNTGTHYTKPRHAACQFLEEDQQLQQTEGWGLFVTHAGSMTTCCVLLFWFSLQLFLFKKGAVYISCYLNSNQKKKKRPWQSQWKVYVGSIDYYCKRYISRPYETINNFPIGAFSVFLYPVIICARYKHGDKYN